MPMLESDILSVEQRESQRGLQLAYRNGRWSYSEDGGRTFKPLTEMPEIGFILAQFLAPYTSIDQLTEEQLDSFIVQAEDMAEAMGAPTAPLQEAAGETGKPDWWDEALFGPWPPMTTVTIRAGFMDENKKWVPDATEQRLDTAYINQTARAVGQISPVVEDETQVVPPVDARVVRGEDVGGPPGTFFIRQPDGRLTPYEPPTAPTAPTEAPAQRVSVPQMVDDMLIEWARTGNDALLDQATSLWEARGQVMGQGGLSYEEAVQMALPYARTPEEARRWIDALTQGQRGQGPSVQRELTEWEQFRQSQQEQARARAQYEAITGVSTAQPPGVIPPVPSFPGLPQPPVVTPQTGPQIVARQQRELAQAAAAEEAGPFAATIGAGLQQLQAQTRAGQEDPLFQAGLGQQAQVQRQQQAEQTTRNMLAQGIPFVQTPLGQAQQGQAPGVFQAPTGAPPVDFDAQINWLNSQRELAIAREEWDLVRMYAAQIAEAHRLRRLARAPTQQAPIGQGRAGEESPGFQAFLGEQAQAQRQRGLAFQAAGQEAGTVPGVFTAPTQQELAFQAAAAEGGPAPAVAAPGRVFQEPDPRTQPFFATLSPAMQQAVLADWQRRGTAFRTTGIEQRPTVAVFQAGPGTQGETVRLTGGGEAERRAQAQAFQGPALQPGVLNPFEQALFDIQERRRQEESKQRRLRQGGQTVFR